MFKPREKTHSPDLLTVLSQEPSSGSRKTFKWDWIEPHPLYDGREYDFAIIGLRNSLERNSWVYPICLPKFKGGRLYPQSRWENYQLLYSLKAMRKDARFSRVATDVNGPSKFVVRMYLKEEQTFFLKNLQP